MKRYNVSKKNIFCDIGPRGRKMKKAKEEVLGSMRLYCVIKKKLKNIKNIIQRNFIFRKGIIYGTVQT